MKYLNPWIRSILNYIGISMVIITVYIFVFIHLMRLEQQSEVANFLTGFYWVISTITTVGYGDVVFNSTPGRLFSVVVQLSGIVMVFGILFTLVITPWLERMMKVKLPTMVSEYAEDHIVICGYNKLVEILIDDLREQNISFVIVEDQEDIIRKLMEKRIPCIFGNPSDENTLDNANIYSARFLIANKSDEENANITLTARELADINIIAIVKDVANTKYLKYAGANRVITPKSLFGRFIGLKAIDPFVSRLMGTTEFFEGISIIEFPIYPKSPLIGKTLREASIHEMTGANIIGIWKMGTLFFDPDPNDLIKENSVLLATGTTKQLSELKEITR